MGRCGRAGIFLDGDECDAIFAYVDKVRNEITSLPEAAYHARRGGRWHKISIFGLRQRRHEIIQQISRWSLVNHAQNYGGHRHRSCRNALSATAGRLVGRASPSPHGVIGLASPGSRHRFA